ncbi:MAG: caspase family protein [Pyrinomonadaceae bacterium]
MKRKSSSPSASRITFSIWTTSALLAVLCFVAPLMAQTSKTAQSRQLEHHNAVNTLPSKEKRWALVIGIDNYEDTQITTLGGATNDAKAVASALIRYAGFPADQVILLASDQPTELRPTRGNVLRRLSNLRGSVPKDGMLLVSFAGHGVERGGQAFLLLSDTQVSNDARLLEETAINVTRMKEAIRETNVGQVILILDACRNDPIGRANADNPLTQAYTRGFNFDVRNKEVTAFVTLYATAVGQRAFEFKEKRQGYFTWELVEALGGKAANEKGEVTLAGLVKYLQDRVPKRVQIDLGREQRPFAIIEGYKADELVIAVAGQSFSAPLTTVSPRESADIRASAEAAAEDGIWKAAQDSNTSNGFDMYIRMYPNGRHITEAKRRLAELQKQAERQPNNPTSGPTFPSAANQGVRITGVSCMCEQYVMLKVPNSVLILGSGWDGGSDIKVLINGQDVSAHLESQDALISMKGTIKELNLRDGRNEVVIIVNGITSNTYVFKQAIKPPVPISRP